MKKSTQYTNQTYTFEAGRERITAFELVLESEKYFLIIYKIEFIL